MLRRRLRVTTDRGSECAIALAREDKLFDGAVLVLEDDRAVVVRAEETSWLVVAPADIAAAIELGYCSGNMAFDALTTETTIQRPDGRLLALDRSRLRSGSGLAGNPSLLGPYRALGTLFAVGRGCHDAAALAEVRAAAADLPGVYAGVTHLPAQAGLWLRILATDGVALRNAMEKAWRQCHLTMLGWACDKRRK